MIFSAQLLNALFQAIIVLPFIIIGGKRRKEDLRALAIFFIMFLLWSVLTNGLAFTIFPGQQWNWVGKTAALVVGALFIIRNKVLTAKETGWRLKFNSGSTGPVIILLLAGVALRTALLAAANHSFANFNTETILFQALVVPLSDEIIFRGILLALLNRVFPQSEDLGGFKMNRGILITSLLFGLSQGFLLQAGFHLQINLIRILLAFVCGIIAAMLKERSGSLLPAVIFHSLWNLIGNH